MLEEGKKERRNEEMKEGREKRKSHESISSVALLSPACLFSKMIQNMCFIIDSENGLKIEYIYSHLVTKAVISSQLLPDFQ